MIAGHKKIIWTLCTLTSAGFLLPCPLFGVAAPLTALPGGGYVAVASDSARRRHNFGDQKSVLYADRDMASTAAKALAH